MSWITNSLTIHSGQDGDSEPTSRPKPQDLLISHRIIVICNIMKGDLYLYVTHVYNTLSYSSSSSSSSDDEQVDALSIFLLYEDDDESKQNSFYISFPLIRHTHVSDWTGKRKSVHLLLPPAAQTSHFTAPWTLPPTKMSRTRNYLLPKIILLLSYTSYTFLSSGRHVSCIDQSMLRFSIINSNVKATISSVFI